MLDATPDTRLDHHNAHHVACGRIAAWACVHTHPQAERWADTNLRRLGYRTYLPLVAATRRDRHTPTMRRSVLVPLFPSYLFLLHDPGEPWTPIRYAPGVRDVIGCNGKPQYARPGAVEAVQADEALRRITPASQSAIARVGRAVATATGPFAGHPAVVTAVTGNHATIAILMFGQLRSVLVDVSCLVSRDEVS
jgi:transcription antitermination factor NusG